jgi:predicted negative regulator of RcsB-dependent stress response
VALKFNQSIIQGSNIMKNINTRLLTALFIVFTTSCLLAQGISTPRTASPAAVFTQTIGISTVEVSYSRPAVKGRNIWGELVPYGWNKQGFGNGNEAPWRAGANENTVIRFSHPAKVCGQMVPAGQYGLFFVIHKDNSGEVILSKDFRSWGSFWYDKNNDQLRAKIQVRDVAHMELLTFDCINLDKNGGELVLNWEKKQFPVPLEFAVDDIVMANAAEELKGTTGFSWQGYSSAANYALQNKTNIPTAKKWIDQAIAQNKSYTTLNTKAGLLRLEGNTAEADKMQQEALRIATEPELNAYGYQLVNENNLEQALKIMHLVTERFPESANAWDSLGEVYALKGDKTNAIQHFKKALSLNPTPAVKANSEKYLKQLGGM